MIIINIAAQYNVTMITTIAFTATAILLLLYCCFCHHSHEQITLIILCHCCFYVRYWLPSLLHRNSQGISNWTPLRKTRWTWHLRVTSASIHWHTMVGPVSALRYSVNLPFHMLDLPSVRSRWAQRLQCRKKNSKAATNIYCCETTFSVGNAV